MHMAETLKKNLKKKEDKRLSKTSDGWRCAAAATAAATSIAIAIAYDELHVEAIVLQFAHERQRTCQREWLDFRVNLIATRFEQRLVARRRHIARLPSPPSQKYIFIQMKKYGLIKKFKKNAHGEEENGKKCTRRRGKR